MLTEDRALPREPEILIRKIRALAGFLQALDLSLDAETAPPPQSRRLSDLTEHAAALRALDPNAGEPLPTWRAILRGLTLAERALARLDELAGGGKPRILDIAHGPPGAVIVAPGGAGADAAEADDVAALLAAVAAERRAWEAGVADEERGVAAARPAYRFRGGRGARDAAPEAAT